LLVERKVSEALRRIPPVNLEVVLLATSPFAWVHCVALLRAILPAGPGRVDEGDMQ
jgi:hypothetical protein